MTDTKISMVGKHRAKAIDAEFGYAGVDNKPQVALMFEITEEGPLQGRTLSWFGFFTPTTQDRTFDSLRYCGWDSDDLEQLGSLSAGTGVFRHEVELVVEEETYNGKTRPKVRWINRTTKRTVDLPKKMDAAALRSFAADMKASAAARRKEEPGSRNGGRSQRSFDDPYPGERDWAPPTDDDIAF